jgi:hypothetical protein
MRFSILLFGCTAEKVRNAKNILHIDGKGSRDSTKPLESSAWRVFAVEGAKNPGFLIGPPKNRPSGRYRMQLATLRTRNRSVRVVSPATMDRDDVASQDSGYTRIRILTKERRKYGEIEIPSRSSSGALRPKSLHLQSDRREQRWLGSRRQSRDGESNFG